MAAVIEIVFKEDPSLPKHKAPCKQCGGTGNDPNFADQPEAGCDNCDGEKTITWRFCMTSNKHPCCECNAEGVETMLCGGEDPGHVCRACIVKLHAEQCGCALWSSVEESVKQ